MTELNAIETAKRLDALVDAAFAPILMVVGIASWAGGVVYRGVPILIRITAVVRARAMSRVVTLDAGTGRIDSPRVVP
ncbi:MAG: hypothetical protein ACOH1H_05495 [Brevundimonas sp.]